MTSKTISNSKELSSKEAGELLGYTHDYISRLCRTGEMNGIRRGREWFVLEEEVEAFKKRHEVVLLEKKKQLSQKLSKIRKEHEAKKRQAKLSKKESSAKKVSVESDSRVVKFHIPKRIMAACVFVLLLGITSWFGSLKETKTNNVSMDLHYDSTPAFSATQIISKGVLEYTQELKSMSIQTVSMWGIVGNMYLSLYMMQGEAMHNAFRDLAYTGDVVLGGYQILGHSFVLGFQNIIDYTSSLFNPGVDFSKKKLNSFTYNVKEGFVYSSQTFYSTMYTHGFVYVVEGFDILTQNIGLNIYTMNSIFKNTSNLLLANVGDAFQSHLLKKESSEVIKIQR